MTEAYRSEHLQSVDRLPGIGPKTAALLQRKGIVTIEDLLLTLPLRYEDRRTVTPISALRPDDRATVIGQVTKIRTLGRRGRSRRTEATLTDAGGEVRVVWFGWGGGEFHQGDRLLVTGDVRAYHDMVQLQNPDAQKIDETVVSGGLRAIYSETEGLRQKSWRKIIRLALERIAPQWSGALPAEVRARHGLLPLGEAVARLHHPTDETSLATLLDPHGVVLRSLFFEEMFAFQLGLARQRAVGRQREGIAYPQPEATCAPLLKTLPFALTVGQEKSLADIFADMADDRPMHRLLHGDVGSGKTVLALLAAFIAAQHGWQAAVMAPTEILARQHAERFTQWLAPHGLSVALVTGSLTGAPRRRLEERIALGLERIVVGTHALLSGGVQFPRLGLVIVDEQHKFGVAQRAALIQKGPQPDVLVLTATPIPRSLALTVYGDLDVSKLDEKPGGRGRVETRLADEGQRAEVYTIVADRLRAGEQCFVVCPRLATIDPRKKDVASLVAELSLGPLTEFGVEVLHGRMKPAARQDVLARFAAKTVQALVATTVIEVGLDVPDASVLVVENADHFGLSQLHQLRGRIGRGERDGLCVLLHNAAVTDEAHARLAMLAACDDGFAIAEADLRQRGPGELFGMRQAGLPSLRFAAWTIHDLQLLSEVRAEALRVLGDDPQLHRPENEWARLTVTQRWGALVGEGGNG
ncbi:MAG TPA: ATP-dependent DNA helicase RecG [bacterium]|nr:ATP-dependent DNA helicase RecG [bacterium]